MYAYPLLVAVVDDEPLVLEGIQELLASAGYKVLLFADAKAFLESDRLQQVDCLISDMKMPAMPGWELLQIVGAQRPSLPVVLMTSGVEEYTSEVLAKRW
jgi:FixJ family two-component response regulator